MNKIKKTKKVDKRNKQVKDLELKKLLKEFEKEYGPAMDELAKL